MTLNISGRMKVKSLKSQFKDEFGLSIRVYDGRSFADDDATLASVRKGDSKGGEITPRKNTKVGNLEDKIMDMFGIKTQISGSDDSYLCNNDLTLKAALEEDKLKMARKEKKAVGSDVSVSEIEQGSDVNKTSHITSLSGISETKQKFRYRIESSNYGGEITLGTVPKDFVDYWMPILEEDCDFDLINAVVDSGEEREDSSPQLGKTWDECDDIEHINASYANGEWSVYAVPADGSDDESDDEKIWEGENAEPVKLYSREVIHNTDIDIENEKNPEDYVPVLSFLSEEKGNFGVWFVNTDEPFDHKKLTFGLLEMNLGEMVERVFYNEEELEINYDYCESRGKAYYASVGFMNKKYRETPEQYTLEILKKGGYFDEVYANYYDE